MERNRLIEILDDVAPALAAKELVPILAHFWFTGSHVMAYADSEGVSISIPLKTEFKGALPQTFLALLKSSSAKTIEMLPDGDNMTVKAASSRFKLAMLPPEDFMFKMPTLDKDIRFPCDAGRFIQAIEHCLGSVGSDTSKADHMGVTLIVDGKTLHVFSTDHETMSYTNLKLTGEVDFERVILRKQFCQQLVRLCGGATELNMVIDDDQVMINHGGTKVFGRNVEPDHNPMDFLSSLDQLAPEAMLKKAVEIPEKLDRILERACIITDAAIEKSKTYVKIGDDKAAFKSMSERGELADTCQLAKHQSIQCYFDPRRLREGYGKFDKIVFGKKAIVMTKANLHFLVAASED